MLNLCLQSSEKQNLYPIAECLEPKFCLLKIGINCCKCRVAGRIGAARNTLCRAVSGFFLRNYGRRRRFACRRARYLIRVQRKIKHR